MLKPLDLQALYIFLCIKVALVTDLAVEKDYILLQIGDTFYPVFLPAVQFTGSDSVEESSEETVEESEEPFD